MRFKISEKSLFAVLMRQPWWVSLVIALCLGLAVRLLAPEEYFVPALSFCFPFVVIAGMAAWKQSRQPSAGRVAATAEAAAAMSWREFADALEAAFQREGFVVKRLTGAADFRLEKDGRATLVAARRWKAATHGVEPLRDLQVACEKAGADAAAYVALGGVSEKAQGFAREQRIRVIGDIELAGLLRLPAKPRAD